MGRDLVALVNVIDWHLIVIIRYICWAPWMSSLSEVVLEWSHIKDLLGITGRIHCLEHTMVVILDRSHIMLIIIMVIKLAVSMMIGRVVHVRIVIWHKDRVW